MEENRPNYYSIIPANVRYDNRLSASEKIFYSEITSLMNKTGECWASNKYFSELYGVDNRTISRWFSKLEKLGYINIELQRDGVNVEKRVVTLMSGGIDKNVMGYRQKCHDPLDKNVQYNNTSINNKTNNKYNNNTSSSEVDEVIKYYKQFNNLPKFIKLTDKRKKSVNARIKDHGVSDIKTAIQLANNSKFLTDNLNSNWYNFDWIFNPNNIIKILEGKYSGGVNNGLQQHIRGLSNEEQDIWDKLQSL